jgi:hypothetical protein
MADKCKCGRKVTRTEIRIVRRCARGHIVGSEIQPAVVRHEIPVELANPQQIAAFHARCEQLDRLTGVKAGTSKAAVKAEFGVDSTLDLSATKMSGALDWLRMAIEQVA